MEEKYGDPFLRNCKQVLFFSNREVKFDVYGKQLKRQK